MRPASKTLYTRNSRALSSILGSPELYSRPHYSSEPHSTDALHSALQITLHLYFQSVRDSCSSRDSHKSSASARSSQEEPASSQERASPPNPEPRRPALPPSSLKGRRNHARTYSVEKELGAGIEGRRRREEASLESELRGPYKAPSSASFTSEELRLSRKELGRSPEIEKEISFAVEELQRGRKEVHHRSAESNFIAEELRMSRKELEEELNQSRKELEEELLLSRKEIHCSPDTKFTSEELRLSRKSLGHDHEIAFALGEKALYALAAVPAPREVLTDLEDWERLSELEAVVRPEKEVVRRRGPPPGNVRLGSYYNFFFLKEPPPRHIGTTISNGGGGGGVALAEERRRSGGAEMWRGEERPELREGATGGAGSRTDSGRVSPPRLRNRSTTPDEEDSASFHETYEREMVRRRRGEEYSLKCVSRQFPGRRRSASFSSRCCGPLDSGHSTHSATGASSRNSSSRSEKSSTRSSRSPSLECVKQGEPFYCLFPAHQYQPFILIFSPSPYPF